MQIAGKFGRDVEDMMHATGVDTALPAKLSGSCLSACTLAYLGGLHRYFTQGSIYGVHRFSFQNSVPDPGDVDTAQIASAKVIEYVAKMGADTQLFSRMAEAGPNGIKIIGIDGLVALNVVNGRVFKEDWTFESLPRGIYLVGKLVDDRGTSKMTFVCDRKSKKLVSMVFIPEAANPNGDVTLARIAVNASTDSGYFVDNEIHRLKSAGRSVTLIPHGEKPSDASEIQVIWPVLPADVAAISSAKTSTGFALLSGTPGVYYGFQLHLGDQGVNMFRNYAADCWR